MTAWYRLGRRLALVVTLGMSAAVVQGQRTDEEERGRRLYREGIGADGNATVAAAGDTGLALPTAFAACANCHGDDGGGKTEAGIIVPDIRGETLDQPYASVRQDGRRRLPYDAARFFLAVTQGVDPSGHPLGPTMPRYRLSEAEAADLISYLKQIDRRSDEGVTDDVIHLGFVLPSEPALVEAAKQDMRVVSTWFDEVNRAGGIYRRRIELQPVEATAAGLAAHPLLAVLVGEDHSGEQASSACEAAKIPLLCVKNEALEDRHYGFSLYPGVGARARALVRYAIAHGDGRPLRVALIYAKANLRPAVLEAVMSAVRPLAAVEARPLTAGKTDEIARSCLQAGVGAVLVLGPSADSGEFVARARGVDWTPWQLWLETPEKSFFNDRAVAVCDQERKQALLASAKLLAEALKSAGRALSRAKVVTALESMRPVQTEHMPSLGFTARRHTAMDGMYVSPLALPPNVPAPEWISSQ